jgi:hypothetical protein
MIQIKFYRNLNKFMNYLKAVKNIVPSYEANENTNKLVDLMEMLKKSDTNGIVHLMNQFSSPKQSTPGHSQFDKYRQNTQSNYETPDGGNSNKLQDKEESKYQSNHIPLLDSVISNYASTRTAAKEKELTNVKSFNSSPQDVNHNSQTSSNSKILKAVEYMHNLIQDPELLDASIDDEPHENYPASE